MAPAIPPYRSALRRPKVGAAYRSSLRRLVSLSRFGSKPGLARITRLLAALENPQKNFKCILIGGTNGKGSTAAMLAGILSGAGYRAGSYFSPSVFSFRERIQIDGKWISKKDFSSTLHEVFPILPSMRDDPPTFFEVMTAMAVLHFSRSHADYAVLEVGLGGRYDATNIVEPELSVITSIGLEHTGVLGRTTKKIAREKAGIMRAGKPLVCAVKDAAALGEIKKISRRLHSPLFLAGEKSAVRRCRRAGLPSFQLSNLAAAAIAARLLGVREPVIRRSLASFVMPARWQEISSKPRVVIDCCHNPSAAKAIQPDLARDFAPHPSSPRVLLFSSMTDKDYSQVLALLAPHFDFIVLCRPPFARAAKMGDLRKAALRALKKTASPGRKNSGHSKNIAAVPNPDSALARSKSLAGKQGRILVCGSMYLLQWLFGEREFRITG